ncbi:cytokinesis regulator [Purpureocillium lavendulum]|uniref:Cytokinesis regulator n=1 Tax=Purpureocillium lavendulum TaxID=1247861 RepID=A0AB34FRR3_9HYPO|nr:cytokinesis regulator [Purpureocillium lavendulum]
MSPLPVSDDENIVECPIMLEQSTGHGQTSMYSMSFPAGHVSEDDLIDTGMAMDVDLPHIANDAATAAADEADNGAETCSASHSGAALCEEMTLFSTPKTVRFADDLETVIPPSPDYHSAASSNSDESYLRIEGCSADSGNGGQWLMSRSMMAAYNAMRGGESIAESDLAEWAARNPDAATERGDILDDHANLLQGGSPPESLQMADNDGQVTQNIFGVPRPEYDHITRMDHASQGGNEDGLPAHIVRGLKRQAQLEGKHDIDGKGALHPIKKPRRGADKDGAALSSPDQKAEQSSSFAEKYDVSDEEGDAVDGRISPCTFRLWAAGVADKDERDDDDKRNETDNDSATRSDVAEMGSPILGTVSDKVDESDAESAGRSDVAETGSVSEMAEPHQANATAGDGKVFWPTPAYVGNFDFVVWQRGVDLSRDLEHCPGRAEDGAEKEPLGPAGQKDIAAALAAPDAPAAFDGIPQVEIYRELERRYVRLQNATQAVADAVAGKRAYAERIRARAPRVQRAAEATTFIEESARRAADEARRRRNDIYRHIEGHLRGVETRAEELESEAARLWAELTELMRLDRSLSDAVVGMAQTVGLSRLDVGDLDDLCERLIQMGRECAAESAPASGGNE